MKLIKDFLAGTIGLLIPYGLCLLVVGSFCRAFEYHYSTEKTVFLYSCCLLYYWLRPSKDDKN